MDFMMKDWGKQWVLGIGLLKMSGGESEVISEAGA